MLWSLDTDLYRISSSQRCKLLNILTSETGMHYDKVLCYSLIGNIIFLMIQKVMVCFKIHVIVNWMKYGIMFQGNICT